MVQGLTGGGRWALDAKGLKSLVTYGKSGDNLFQMGRGRRGGDADRLESGGGGKGGGVHGPGLEEDP